MAILAYVWSRNYKQSVARTYHQDNPWKARWARTKLSISDIVYKPLYSLERIIVK